VTILRKPFLKSTQHPRGAEDSDILITAIDQIFREGHGDFSHGVELSSATPENLPRNPGRLSGSSLRQRVADRCTLRLETVLRSVAMRKAAMSVSCSS